MTKSAKINIPVPSNPLKTRDLTGEVTSNQRSNCRTWDNRFNRWSKAGIWDMIFEAIVDSHNVDTIMVDSTSIRAHPTAAKLKKTDKRRCLGRSRGGLGTKIHASNNQDGLPLKLELTPNQANDAPPCGTLLTGLQPGQWVLADKAYDVDWIRNMIWEQGAIDVIPSKSNRKTPKEFDKVMYRQRNKIERFFGSLKASFRRIATRYEQTCKLPRDDQISVCAALA